MTSPFILERAKVLYEADAEGHLHYPIPWDRLNPGRQNYYIAMAQALTDAETAKGWKVMDKGMTEAMYRAAFDAMDRNTDREGVVDPIGPHEVFNVTFDAAPAWPGGEK